ncbi:exosortase family protein XrtF [Confluentibacter lentus]|uniref:exosortase family protein XrtF n=1 Tax=Confluentibacter lentus TaxID=1699412 RepID=UPI000C283D77|nr:exosortase family protein XrtF [Confluentibacter lentus]
MKELFIKYKSVTRFVLTFLIVYVTLSMAYKFYLKFSDGSQFYPDYMTHLVAIQSQDLLNVLDYNAVVIPHPDEPSMKLIVNGKFLARIIEGCNSVSIIILFVSFIVAFSGNVKETIIFTLSGSVLLYVVNLLRIVVLSIGLYHYPWRSGILHQVVFPGIIYGMVFLLWMFWANRFSKLTKKNE